MRGITLILVITFCFSFSDDSRFNKELVEIRVDTSSESINNEKLPITCTITNKINHTIDTLTSKIIKLESRGNSMAKGDLVNGVHKSYGLFQIQAICVKECNNKWGTKYTHKDMFNVLKAEDVFRKTLTYGIKKHIKEFNEFPTEENIVRMWNVSYYNYLIKGKKYFKDYQNINI